MRLDEKFILVTAMMVAPGVVSCLAQENVAGPEPRGAVVGPDDTITILALNVDEISKEWRVGSSGDLSLPLIGRVRVAGYTTAQIEKEIRERLDRLVIDPQVTVYISEIRSKPVSVTGAVQNPGIIQMEGSKTLFDVLMMAGGSKDAGPAVTVTRSVEQGKIPYPGIRRKTERATAGATEAQRRKAGRVARGRDTLDQRPS